MLEPVVAWSPEPKYFGTNMIPATQTATITTMITTTVTRDFFLAIFPPPSLLILIPSLPQA
jgi:hypothetical protein